MTERVVDLVITGRVQGVGFRAWMAEEADRRELAGWVMNHRDGTVEAVLSGEDRVVDEMIAACRKGPLGARIDNIEIGSAPAPAGSGFLVLPTD